ncbi:MAG TPA: hypothetical protein PLH11_00595 [Gemmobacter sp.]|nr:hypothetical protein [Gemmobacter sp.]
MKTAIGLSATGAISLSEAAGRLGVNTATIRNLVAAGYLQEVQKPHNSSERWLVVDEKSVESFSDQFISAANLARSLRRDTANLCRELYKDGIEPLILMATIGSSFVVRMLVERDVMTQ